MTAILTNREAEEASKNADALATGETWLLERMKPLFAREMDEATYPETHQVARIFHDTIVRELRMRAQRNG